MQASALAREIGSRRWLSTVEATIDGRVVDVTATSSGRIAHVLVAEGDLVAQGARLLELDEVVSASTRAHVAIHAPARGRVVMTHRLVPGEWASYGQPILTLLEDDDVWVLARFDAVDFERLRIGQSAAVRAGGRLLAAKVCALSAGDLTAVLDFVLRPIALQPGLIASAVVVADRHGT